jgi:hypothetical protein
MDKKLSYESTLEEIKYQASRLTELVMSKLIIENKIPEEIKAPEPKFSLPNPGTHSPLTEEDFKSAADLLNCEVNCIKAVTQVEAPGSGFLPSGNPKILFEAHIFSKNTSRKYDKTDPDISSQTWNKALYKGGEKEYLRLTKAMDLDIKAALRSASWGRFQIMGFNHVSTGYDTIEKFVLAMYESEKNHLMAFVNFLKHSKLDKPLREKRWAAFAKGYNGSGYAANKYDLKLQDAYTKLSK